MASFKLTRIFHLHTTTKMDDPDIPQSIPCVQDVGGQEKATGMRGMNHSRRKFMICGCALVVAAAIAFCMFTAILPAWYNGLAKTVSTGQSNHSIAADKTKSGSSASSQNMWNDQTPVPTSFPQEWSMLSGPPGLGIFSRFESADTVRICANSGVVILWHSGQSPNPVGTGKEIVVSEDYFNTQGQLVIWRPENPYNDDEYTLDYKDTVSVIGYKWSGIVGKRTYEIYVDKLGGKTAPSPVFKVRLIQ